MILQACNTGMLDALASHLSVNWVCHCFFTVVNTGQCMFALDIQERSRAKALWYGSCGLHLPINVGVLAPVSWLFLQLSCCGCGPACVLTWFYRLFFICVTCLSTVIYAQHSPFVFALTILVHNALHKVLFDNICWVASTGERRWIWAV